MFIALLASSCVCTLSQIPPQYIYAGTDCQALLPDYKSKVIVTDNCAVKLVEQIPDPGTILNAANQVVNVWIKATDVFNNTSQVTFTVALIDTIPPTISGEVLTQSTYQMIDEAYNRADKLIVNVMEHFDATFPYEQFGLDRNAQDSTFYKKGMIVWTSTGHAVTGHGNRYWTFPSAGDTLILRNYY